MAMHTLMTAAEFDALPPDEDRRWELLNGEVIELPSATLKHNLILNKLISLLAQYLEEQSDKTSVPDTEFAIGPNLRLRPDLAILQEDKLTSQDLEKLPVIVLPEIAVEIVSPSESAQELDKKVNAYLTAGVEEVWVMYHQTQTVLIHRLHELQKFQAGGQFSTLLLPGWSVPVSALFQVRKQISLPDQSPAG